MKKKVGVVVAAVALLALAGGLSLNAVRASGGITSTKAEASLQANTVDPLASGKAKSEQRTDRTRFSVEVEDVSTSGPHAVHISRSGSEILNSPVSVDVDALGFGELELNTQDGAVNVPVVLAGDLVEVSNPGGTVVLSTTLAPK
jgi:hypothetical protein